MGVTQLAVMLAATLPHQHKLVLGKDVMKSHVWLSCQGAQLGAVAVSWLLEVCEGVVAKGPRHPQLPVKHALRAHIPASCCYALRL